MPKISVSDRLNQVPASPIREYVPLSQAAEREGVKVYHLNIGDPDILTPEVMIRVLSDWKINPLGYAPSQGTIKYLESLLSYYHQLGYNYLETKNLQVTIGGSEAIYMAMFASCNPGDEIIVFEPFYTNYNSYAATSGVKLIPIKTDIADGFHFPGPKAIEAKITGRTRAILYCNPNNPTGTVYTKNEIEMLVSLAAKHNLFLLSDEVYREYVFDGKKQVSLLNYFPEYPENLIVLDSMSKRYSLCGLRLGTLISLNPEIMSGVLRIAQGRLSAGIVDQAIASSLTEVPRSYLTDVQKEYWERRDVLFEGLKNIPGVIIPKPEGAFYTIVGLPVDNAKNFCRWLLTDFRDHGETIMLAPASGFYATAGLGDKEVRIAYVLNKKSLLRSIEILKIALSVYPHKL